MRRLFFALPRLALLPANSAVDVASADASAVSTAAWRAMTSKRCLADIASVAKAWLLAVCAVLIPTLLDAEQVAAQTKYRFINIADSRGSLAGFRDQVSINNHGAVAFIAGEDNSSAQGIFVGSGGSLTTIAHTNGPFYAFLVDKGPDINDKGTVAFHASIDIGGSGVFTGDGITTTSVMTVGGAGPRGALYEPVINQNGTVAFWARVGAEEGIYIANGGDVALAADPWTISRQDNFISISDDGSVSFLGRAVDGTRGVFKVNHGAVEPILQLGAPVQVGQITAPINLISSHAMNSTGTTAVTVIFPGMSDHIFAVKDGVITQLTDQVQPVVFASEKELAINDAGTVAFVGYTPFPRLETPGIYTGDDPVKDKVFERGGMLFGSRAGPSLGGIDINDRGDIAFRYFLANGVQGIAVAKVVPEPGCAALLVAVVLAYVAQWQTGRTPRRTSG